MKNKEITGYNNKVYSSNEDLNTYKFMQMKKMHYN